MKYLVSISIGLFIILSACPGSLAQEQDYYGGSLKGTISVSPSFLSLNALTLKSCHVGMAEGIRGSFVNPAALTDVKNLEIAFAMSGGRSWRANSQLSLDAGDMVGELEVPLDFLLRRRGGIGRFSLAARTPIFNAGVGFLETEHLGIHLSGIQNVYQELDVDIPYTLTSADVPGLPDGVEIPVVFHIEGEAQLDLDGSIDSELDQKPMMVALANNLGPFRVGAGIKFYSIDGYLMSNIEINGEGSLSGSAPVDSGAWSVNLEGTAAIKRQMLLGYQGTGQVKGDAVALVLGTQMKGKYAGIGVAVEVNTPVSLVSAYQSNSSIAFGAPTIENLGGDIQVDTTGKSIYGNVDVDLSTIPMQEGETVMDGVVYKMPAEAKLRVGVAVHLPLFTIAVDAGRSFSLEKNSSNLYFLLVGLELKPLEVMSIHSIVEVSTRTIQFAEMNMDVPSATALVGTSLHLTPFLELNASLSANTLTYLGSSWERLAHEFDPHKVLQTALASMGVTVSF
ncbi:MAG: hypothetical protein ACE5JA_08940 [bacterium]